MLVLGARGLVSAVLAAGLTAALLTAPASGEDLNPPSSVRIGVVSSLFRDTPEPMIQTVMRPFKSLMEAQTGLTGQVLPGGDAESLGGQLVKDKVQLGVFHGFEFAWARLKYPALKPLMIVINQHRSQKAHLVVRADSTITSFADLQGKLVALPRFSKEHCRLFMERRCESCGQTAERHFGQITTPADAEDALDNVIDGTVQAAVVDTVALECYEKRKPGRFAKVNTALESEPFPAGVIAYRPGALDDDTLKRFREGMISANQTRRGQQLLTMCRVTGFEHVPEDFDQALADIVKAYPPPAASK